MLVNLFSKEHVGNHEIPQLLSEYIKIITIFLLFFGFNSVSYSDTSTNEAAVASSPPAYDYKNLKSNDDLISDFPDNVIIYPPEKPPRPPFIPSGPPKPSINAKGSLNIGIIHEELHKIYDDCTLDTNKAFEGVDPEQGDTTHKHIKSGSTRLKSRQNWRCGGYRMGINDKFEDILKYRCNSVTMASEESCLLNEHERVEEEEYFKCENEKEWFVKLPSYFFYNLEFNSTLNISRNLYQTAEIRVYCDREGGWETGFFERFFGRTSPKSGHIKVVQLAPFNRFGGPGLAEKIIPTVEAKILKGLREQYIGTDRNLVAKMKHVIDLEGLSGSPCSSLGIDGDNSVPLADRNIIWDIPPSEPVFTDR